MKKIILMLIIIVLIGVVFVIYNKYFFEKSEKTFLTKEECEKVTETTCSFAMCDYVPEGKTFEEVCGKDFKKGWKPNN